jgi:hypothetical protein
MMPDDALNKIRSVDIYYHYRIRSFCFFDKDGALLRNIGYTTDAEFKETVVLAENEVIVVVVAELFQDYQ